MGCLRYLVVSQRHFVYEEKRAFFSDRFLGPPGSAKARFGKSPVRQKPGSAKARFGKSMSFRISASLFGCFAARLVCSAAPV